MFTGCRGRGLRIVYGFLPDLGEMGRRLTDCFWIFTGFGRGGLRIVYGFLPDLGEEACGLCADVYRIWGEEAHGFLPELHGGGGLRIVYGCLPDLGEEAYGLFTVFLPDLGEEAYGLFTDFDRM